MKPVNQTIEGRENGNCLAACIASILECDINEVPNVANNSSWLKNLNEEYLNGKGYHLMTIHSDNPAEYIKGHHLIMGHNGRIDCYHAKVGFNGKEVHDPSMIKSTLTDIHYGLLLKIL